MTTDVEPPANRYPKPKAKDAGIFSRQSANRAAYRASKNCGKKINLSIVNVLFLIEGKSRPNPALNKIRPNVPDHISESALLSKPLNIS